ncbi:hypothetical protein [Vibrio rhodolitus]|uniref:hypothetical protein n=1 Tax=Vibrio rhodolitus TaxID=2231649 RepID=UPI000E0C0285|nr:hypothetical protein [Vibrio rhodolitus]
MSQSITRSRFKLLALITVFALPAILAKLVLTQQWYNSGVTNKGELIEPAQTFKSLGLDNPYQGEKWQLGYLVPAQCDAFCLKQIHYLQQSHIALGKYQQRVVPLVLVDKNSDIQALADLELDMVAVNGSFSQIVSQFEYVIVDPLGQLVMRYPQVKSEDELIPQSKGLLADLRKLLKLSRVG